MLYLVVVLLVELLELLLLLLPEVHVLLGLLAGSERTASVADRTYTQRDSSMQDVNANKRSFCVSPAFPCSSAMALDRVGAVEEVLGAREEAQDLASSLDAIAEGQRMMQWTKTKTE